MDRQRVAKSGGQHEAITAIEGRVDPPVASSRAGRAFRCAGVALSLVTVGLVANVLQLLTIPLHFVSRSLAHRLNSYATHLAWALCDYFIRGQDNVRLSLSGLDRIPAGESAFVLSNHAFFGDFFLIHALARERQMMAYCRYFLKASLSMRWAALLII